ncbi:MAG: D-alanyl-D-alanine carboxypeptidase [Clostridiales bacterium]|nr:D-alanyl-D-alanine carboxypeptidase [Clostridiales bacterium]
MYIVHRRPHLKKPDLRRLPALAAALLLAVGTGAVCLTMANEPPLLPTTAQPGTVAARGAAGSAAKEAVKVEGLSANPPGVSAKAAILLEASSGKILMEKNAYERLPMASTTKIMTSLLLAERGNLEETLVTTRQMVTVEGSSMGLQAGDTVSYHDLLYGMLLASGNDAANTTAIALGGSLTGFAQMMNDKAAELGLTSTHFVTPSGLDDPEHYTTACDLARLAAYAMENPDFKAAASSKSATLCYGNPPYKRTLSNHNKLLARYEGTIGVKTGFTKKSGRCLVSSAERDGARLIAVTLNAPDDWNDHENLFNFGFSQLENAELDVSLPVDSLQVAGGSADRVALQVIPQSLSLLKGEAARLERKIYLPAFLYTPVEAGQTVGRIEYYLDGERVATAEILAAGQVAPLPEDPQGQREKLFYWLFQLLGRSVR